MARSANRLEGTSSTSDDASSAVDDHSVAVVPEPGRASLPEARAIRLQDRKRVRTFSGQLVTLALVLVLCVLCLPPVYYVLEASLGDGATGLRQMLDDPNLGKTLWVTVALGFGSVVFATTLGTTLAWCAHGLPPGRRWLGFLPLIVLIEPTLAAVTGYNYLFSPVIGFGNALLRKVLFWHEFQEGPIDVNTVPFMIFTTGLLLMGFVYLFVRSALTQLNQDIFDATAACGASPTRAFVTVILPLIRPAILYAGLTVMLLSLGQFSVPLFYGRQEGINVLSTSMFQGLQRFPPNFEMAAAYGIPIVIAGIMFVGFQRLVLRDQGRYVTTGAKGTARPLAHSGWLAQGALIAYGLIAVVAPITAVAIVSVQPFWSENVIPSDFTLDNFREVLADDNLVGAIRNSMLYAVITSLLVLPLGYLCARTIYARATRRVLANVADLLVSLVLGIPAVIFGIGFLLAFTRGPLNLYSKDAGVIVVYVVLLLPFVTRILLVAMVGLGTNLMEAGAANGAGLLRRTFAIDLPMLRPAIGSAAALVIIITSHEFAASVLIRSPDTLVMGSVLYERWLDGFNSVVAVMALLMTIVTAIGAILAVVLGGRQGMREVAR